MINVDELRLGNQVKYTYENDTPLIKRISHIGYEFVGFYGENQQEELQYVTPILLTTELLEKSGLCLKGANFHTARYGYKATRFDVVYKRVEKVFFFCKNNAHLRGIKYVHELQNLYFELTGLELTVGGEL